MPPPAPPCCQVQIPAADLEAWVLDQPPVTALTHLDSLSSRQDLRTVKLFSLNDYLGLSTHPAVRQAVADSARACGNGERREWRSGRGAYLNKAQKQMPLVVQPYACPWALV